MITIPNGFQDLGRRSSIEGRSVKFVHEDRDDQQPQSFKGEEYTDRTFYLNALGIACSLGNSCESVYQSLIQSGEQMDSVCLTSLLSGRSVLEKNLSFDLPEIPEALQYLDSRNNRLLCLVLDQIALEVESVKARYGTQRIGVVLGTSSSGMKEGEQAYIHRCETGNWPKNYSYSQQELASPSIFAKQYFSLSGPSYTVSTACSSGAKALCAGRRLLEVNLCDAVIVGGVDTMCDVIRNGFDSLELLSESVCNPFSKNRNGITLGQGAAIFLMTREQQNTDSSIIFKGYGESSDACHISAPDPMGYGAESAIKQALQMTNLITDDISYINLHGTGSHLNDAMESICIDRNFKHNVLCSSTKGLTGHTLGASGAVEAAFLWLCMSHENIDGAVTIPFHAWDNEPDSRVPQLNFSTKGQLVKATNGQLHMMSNSFAFGGSNVSLVLSKEL